MGQLVRAERRFERRAVVSGSPGGGGGGGGITDIQAYLLDHGTPGLTIAGARPEVKNFSSFAADGMTGMNTQVPQPLPNGMGRYMVATYDNWGVGWDAAAAARFPATKVSNWDNPAPNPVTYKASFSEPDGSAFYDGRFYCIRHADGTTTFLPDFPEQVTVAGGDSADAYFDLGVARAPGTTLVEHCYVSCGLGQTFWRHQAFLAGDRGEAVTISSGEPDKTHQMLSTSQNVAGDGAWSSSIRHVDSPGALVREPVIFVGDSHVAGNYAYQQMLKRGAYPHVVIARGGETAHNFIVTAGQADYRKRLGALGGFTRAWIQYGTNDLVLSATVTTLATLKSKLASIRALVTSWGAQAVVMGTLPPNAQSTDNWATLANQKRSPARGDQEPTAQAWNAYLRQGAGDVPFWLHADGFYVAEFGGSVEVIEISSIPGEGLLRKWKPIGGQPTTTDAIHLTTQVAKDEGDKNLSDAANRFLVAGGLEEAA